MKYLVAVDASSESERALNYIQNFANPESDQFVLISVVEPSAIIHTGWLPMAAVDNYDDAARAGAKAALKEYVAQARNSGYTVEGYVCTGVPKEVICDRAVQYEVDCIVVGARGLGAVKRFFLGSVSSYVVHHTSVNVLVVKGQRAGEPREEGAATRFAYAFDGSDISKLAFQVLASTAKANDIVFALYVQEPLLPAYALADPSVMVTIAAEEQKERERHAKYLEETHAAACAEFGGEGVAVVKSGDARHAICETCVENDVDVLVMGSRGLGAVERALLGSVSSSCLHDAKVDAVLIVRPPPEADGTGPSDADTPNGDTIDMEEAGAPDISTDVDN